ncbi:MAG: hypothetical protein U0929_12340 [Planctomycetaceae bacterium]
MKRLVLILILGVVIVGLVGFQRGWFTLTSTRSTNGGNVDINLNIDSDKAKSDAKQMSPLNR